MDRLARSLREAAVVEKGDYHYFVHPVSDGVPAVEPALLREIVVRIVQRVEVADVEKIVTPAAMGIHISTALSLATDLPVAVVRKRQYGLPGEVSLSQVTGYAESEMYLNDVHAGERVLVVDDVLSTGGTLAALTDALDDIGAEIVDIVAVIRKVGGENAVAHRDVTSLISVDVVDGEVVIVDEDGNG